MRIYNEDGTVIKGVSKDQKKIHSGFDGISYMSILEKKMIPSIKERYSGPLTNLLFIQDNASIHNTVITDKEKIEPNDNQQSNIDENETVNAKERSVKTILDSEGIELEKWPPYSPDLNPVENVWALLNKVKEEEIDKIILYNQMNNVKIKLPTNKFEMFRFILECWKKVDNNYVVNCYNSYLSRLEMVRKHEGDNDFSYSRKRFKN